jgi:hypothetical protein
MHVEPAYSYSLVPRRAQHRVRRQIVQSVVQPAADQGTHYTADGASHCGSDSHRGFDLRRLMAVIRAHAAA